MHVHAMQLQPLPCVALLIHIYLGVTADSQDGGDSQGTGRHCSAGGRSPRDTAEARRTGWCSLCAAVSATLVLGPVSLTRSPHPCHPAHMHVHTRPLIHTPLAFNKALV